MNLNKFEEAEVNEWYLVVLASPEGVRVYPPFVAKYLGEETKNSTHEGWQLLGIIDHEFIYCFDVIRYMKIREIFKEV